RLRFGLLGLAALASDGDVSHGGGVRGAVPVVLAGRDDDDVTRVDDLLLVVGRDHAGALGDDEDLVASVLVKLVARAGAEAHDAQVEVGTVVWLEDVLTGD